MHTQTLSSEEHAKAERLAFFLAQSVMPQEQKEAWLNLLPLMSQEQVQQLLAVLEREHGSYVQSSTAFLADLKKLESDLRSQIQQLKQEERSMIEAFIQSKIAEHL